MAAFLADECFSGFIIRALRAAGFDIVKSADVAGGAEDPDVLALAVKEGRILLTEDNDFGELTIRLGLQTVGVVRVDLKSLSKTAQAAEVVRMLTVLGDQVSGAMVTLEPGRARVRPIRGI